MRRKRLALLVLGCLVAAGCSQLERLTIVRPSAHQRGYTQVAPRYDVSGKHAQDMGDPTLLLASASLLYQQGKFDEAQASALKVLKAQPGSGDAQTLLGLIAEARGEEAAAGKYFQAAATGSQGNGIYANNYGRWLCANGQAQASLLWFDRALADPAYSTPAVALANAGACAEKAGQPVRAEASWRAVLALEPENVPALSGMAALEYARGAYLEARAFAERWLALAPDDPAALQLAARIEEKTGDNVAASRYLLRLQAISSGSSTVLPRQ